MATERAFWACLHLSPFDQARAALAGRLVYREEIFSQVIPTHALGQLNGYEDRRLGRPGVGSRFSAASSSEFMPYSRSACRSSARSAALPRAVPLMNAPLLKHRRSRPEAGPAQLHRLAQ